MKKTKASLLLVLVCVLFGKVAMAQEESIEDDQANSTIQPILLDKEVISGLSLEQIVLDDQPGRAFFQKNLYRGEDLSVYVVSSQSWLGEMNNFPIDEYVFMFNGKARVRPVGEDDRMFYTGEHFFAPKGFSGEWEIMAGDHYHYELSVITTPRAERVLKSRNLRPFSFDKEVLSGINIDLGDTPHHKELLVKGDELSISLQAELPRKIDLTEPLKEQVLHIMSGVVKIISPNGEMHEFHTGDFLVLPQGYVGTWESAGHGMVKYLVIEKV